MIGPIHIAIALSCGVVAGASKFPLALLAAGAILPDLGHPQSFVGRVSFPICFPLNKLVGHRGAFRSFWLLGFCVLFGWWCWQQLILIGSGAILHVLAF